MNEYGIRDGTLHCGFIRLHSVDGLVNLGIRDVGELLFWSWILVVSWGGRVSSGLAVGKKVEWRSLLFSSLLKARLVTHFMMGSLLRSMGILDLVASKGGNEMNLDACHIPDALRFSSHATQWSSFACFMCCAYLLHYCLYSLCTG